MPVSFLAAERESEEEESPGEMDSDKWCGRITSIGSHMKARHA
jgi:hypothetical protein